jgi:pimeloyl-ACP methyl ester carboxylesterase
MLLFGCNLQEKLLYYPDARVPDADELRRNGLAFWPAREGYRGFAGKVPNGKVKGTVVVFHGNAATAADRLYYLEPLHRLGYRVVLAEYPGYGGRGGKPGEAAFVGDALETIRLAEKAGAPLYLVGESLGSAVAAGVAREAGERIAGIVLLTPWANLATLAQEKFPFLPVRLFLTDLYDSATNLRSFTGPVAIVAAERDEIVPPRHAEELFRALPGKKRMWTLPGVGHNDWPDTVSENHWRAIMDFVAAPATAAAG